MNEALKNASINDVVIIAVGQSEFNDKNANWTGGQNIPVVVDNANENYPIWTEWDAGQRDLYFLNSNGEYAFSYNVSNGSPNALNIDIMNIDLNGNISDWENDPVYNSIIELMNWGQGCANVDACNYDQISNYDNEACWFKNEGCECSDGEGSEVDECGVCNGDGIGDGECDCDGGTLSLFNGLIPDDFSIHSIYPNPFNPVTNITYGLPEHVNVQIIVYDLSGKQVETLMNGFQAPGYHSVNWYANNLPSGVYLIRLESGEFIQTQKVVLIK